MVLIIYIILILLFLPTLAHILYFLHVKINVPFSYSFLHSFLLTQNALTVHLCHSPFHQAHFKDNSFFIKCNKVLQCHPTAGSNGFPSPESLRIFCANSTHCNTSSMESPEIELMTSLLVVFWNQIHSSFLFNKASRWSNYIEGTHSFLSVHVRICNQMSFLHIHFKFSFQSFIDLEVTKKEVRSLW